jgi:hypothetical protein
MQVTPCHERDDEGIPLPESAGMYRSSTKMQPRVFDIWKPSQRSRDRILGRSGDRIDFSRQTARWRRGDFDARIGPDIQARLQVPFCRRITMARSAMHPAAGWGAALGVVFAAGVHLWFGAGGNSVEKTEAMALLAAFVVGLAKVVAVNRMAIGGEMNGPDSMPRVVRAVLTARATSDAAAANVVGFMLGVGSYCAWTLRR